MHEVETIEYRGHKIKIYIDELGEDPRKCHNLGIMKCGNDRYRLGDIQIKKGEFSSWEDVKKDIEESGGLCILPLKIYDHSGVCMSTAINSYPFNDRWDSSFVGFIYTTREKLREMGLLTGKKITKKLLARAAESLENEVQIYSYWLEGSVYWYKVEDEKYNEEIGSCGGFFGHDWKENGLLDYAKNDIDCYIRQKKEQRKKTAEHITKAIYG